MEITILTVPNGKEQKKKANGRKAKRLVYMIWCARQRVHLDKTGGEKKVESRNHMMPIVVKYCQVITQIEGKLVSRSSWIEAIAVPALVERLAC